MAKTVDLKGLAELMPTVAEAIVLDATKLVTEVAIAVVADVAMGTPVDVGTARSNWIVALGSPLYNIRAAFSPHPSRWRPPYADPGTDRSETQNQAGAVWSTIGAVKHRKPDQPIYINNILPYIGRLNSGHSKQAPAGFVERGVQSGTDRAVSAFKFENLKRAL